VPYGVYDLAANSGWVSVGVDHDTAAFAVNSIRQWWLTIGRARYPQASRLLITAKPAPAKAGGGGSNGSRVRLWKRELQKLANEFGIDIVVSHLPPHFRIEDGTVNLSGRASRMQATGSGLGDSIANRCYRFPPRLGMFESWKPFARRQ
jgi:DDE family transposase